MSVRLLSPAESISISLAQSRKLYDEISTIREFPEVHKIFEATLNDLGIPKLFNSILNIYILHYPYEIINIDEDVQVYSFAAINGHQGDPLENKKLIDEYGQDVQSPYILPIDAPFVALGNVNNKSSKYEITSVAHEFSHILISAIEDNDELLSTLVKMVPINLQAMEPEEAFCIIFEVKALKRLFNGQEIVEYLLDRYVKDDVEDDDPYLHDIKAIVGSVPTI